VLLLKDHSLFHFANTHVFHILYINASHERDPYHKDVQNNSFMFCVRKRKEFLDHNLLNADRFMSCAILTPYFDVMHVLSHVLR